jgi:hypothetical protein
MGCTRPPRAFLCWGAGTSRGGDLGIHLEHAMN